MGVSVAVNPPKTPVTEGSGGIAASSVPGVYKMPGPPAPFVPTPFPNIGRSSDNMDCTKTLKVEGKKVANKGTTFKSKGSPDAASKGSGGGVVSSTEEGTTEFTAPGSMNVKAEGKNVQQLGDAMANDDKNGGLTVANVQAAATALGISVDDAKVICEAFCQALAEHKDNVKSGKNLEKGYKITNRFNELLKAKNVPGLAVEPTYLISAQGVAELLTPDVFAGVGRALAEIVPEAAVKLGGLLASGVAAAPGGGGSVPAMAGVALAGVIAYAGKYLKDIKAIFGVGTDFLGRTSVPDVTLTRDGLTKALDAKFPNDRPRANQPKDFKRIDHEGEYREINCETCGCC